MKIFETVLVLVLLIVAILAVIKHQLKITMASSYYDNSGDDDDLTSMSNDTLPF